MAPIWQARKAKKRPQTDPDLRIAVVAPVRHTPLVTGNIARFLVMGPPAVNPWSPHALFATHHQCA
ncbi:MAG: hypothetical protein OHK0048_12530 [Rhodoferax sp.]